MQVMTFGYNDDPSSLRCALDCRGRSARGEVFAPGARSKALRTSTSYPGWHSRRQSYTRCGSLRATAVSAGMALAIQLHQVGLRSIHSLVTALQLVRRYEIISDKGVSLSTAAPFVGVSSARVLERRCRSVTGTTIADVRRSLNLDRFCDAIANQLLRLV